MHFLLNKIHRKRITYMLWFYYICILSHTEKKNKCKKILKNSDETTFFINFFLPKNSHTEEVDKNWTNKSYKNFNFEISITFYFINFIVHSVFGFHGKSCLENQVILMSYYCLTKQPLRFVQRLFFCLKILTPRN